jgi:hypothetical protein
MATTRRSKRNAPGRRIQRPSTGAAVANVSRSEPSSITEIQPLKGLGCGAKAAACLT